MQTNNLKRRIFEDLTSKAFADYCKKNIYPALNEIKAKAKEASNFTKKCLFVAIVALSVFGVSLVSIFIPDTTFKGILGTILHLLKAFFPLIFLVFPAVSVISFWLAAVGGFARNMYIKTSILEKVFSYWGDFKYIARPTTKEDMNNPAHAFKVLTSALHSMSVFANVAESGFWVDDCFAGKYNNMDISIAEVSASITKSKNNDITVFKGGIVRMPSFKSFKAKTVIKSRLNGKDLFSGDLKEVKLEDPNFSKIYRVFSGDQIEARYLITTSFMKRLLELRQSMKCEVSVLFENGEVFLLIHNNKNLFELPDKKNLASFKNYQGPVVDFLNILYTIEAMKLDKNIGM